MTFEFQCGYIKLYWTTVVPSAYTWPTATSAREWATEELSDCRRDTLALKPKLFTRWTFTEQFFSLRYLTRNSKTISSFSR